MHRARRHLKRPTSSLPKSSDCPNRISFSKLIESYLTLFFNNLFQPSKEPCQTTLPYIQPQPFMLQINSYLFYSFLNSSYCILLTYTPLPILLYKYSTLHSSLQLSCCKGDSINPSFQFLQFLLDSGLIQSICYLSQHYVFHKLDRHILITIQEPSKFVLKF